MKNTNQGIILKDTNAGSINVNQIYNTNGSNKFNFSLNLNKEFEG